MSSGRETFAPYIGMALDPDFQYMRRPDLKGERMSASKTWKQSLGPRIPEAWAREIDIFETQIELRKKGKVEEKLFAETRLRSGTYGHSYDNGHRHDAEKTQSLPSPSGELTERPVTMWNAPGMQRIKI